MSKTIQEVAHGNRKYPWKRWADGRLHRAKAGKHFSCTTSHFRRALSMHAHRNDLTVTTRTNGDTVSFQFFDAA